MIVGKGVGAEAPEGELVFTNKKNSCERRYDHDGEHTCVDTVLEKAPILMTIVSYVYC